MGALGGSITPRIREVQVVSKEEKEVFDTFLVEINR
jgi:hypothetical protein